MHAHTKINAPQYVHACAIIECDKLNYKSHDTPVLTIIITAYCNTYVTWTIIVAATIIILCILIHYYTVMCITVSFGTIPPSDPFVS